LHLDGVGGRCGVHGHLDLQFSGAFERNALLEELGQLGGLPALLVFVDLSNELYRN